MGNMLSSRLGDESLTILAKKAFFTYDGTTPKIDAVRNNDIVDTGELGRTTDPRLRVARNDVGYRTMTYDAAGNEVAYVATRTYSARNLLGSVQNPGETSSDAHRVTYGYDGRGIRVSRSELQADCANATRYSFYSPELQRLSVTSDNGPNVWSSRIGTNAVPEVKHEFVWFAGEPLAQLSPTYTDGAHWYFNDHLATPLLQTNQSATVVWRVEYEPYGGIWERRVPVPIEEGPTPVVDQPLRFPGQEAAINWEGMEERYNIFRWYRSGWGRYTQADPIGLMGGENLYRYAGANPLSNTDHLGLVSWNCNIGYVSYETPGAGIGGATLVAKCQSECGKKKRVNATVMGNAGGASALSPLPAGAGYSTNVTLNDNFAEPKKDALGGLIAIGSIGGGVGFSPLNWSFTYYRLGAANGHSTGVSPFMASLGIDAYIGAGAVVDANTECCD